MGLSSFNVEVAGAMFLIKKTRLAFVFDLIWFAIFMIAIVANFFSKKGIIISKGEREQNF